MKRFLSIFPGFILLCNCTFAQFTLKIEISDLRNNTGKVMIQVFDASEKTIVEEMSDIKDRSCIFIIKNLKAGKYAVRYYHDENLNQTMETNIAGKPTEGYGFSNNVKDRFGPPPFDKWLFDVNENKTIVLKPTY